MRASGDDRGRGSEEYPPEGVSGAEAGILAAASENLVAVPRVVAGHPAAVLRAGEPRPVAVRRVAEVGKIHPEVERPAAEDRSAGVGTPAAVTAAAGG
ncbi:hypothetical protein AB4305_19685 [Nocardia sp. 2YAB30]|uniref:hypothetical protein n=1 Tax=unclassified Nocardia TaxID=2637762 RepID=UPI003F984B3A